MKKIVLLVILLIFHITSFTQVNPILFQHLTSDEGLSQGHILCMMQDSEGYIWAGTYFGLNRYNGYTIDVFNADNNNPNSMFIDMASSILEDKRGNIWIGTWGVDIFDKKTETFRHIPANADDGSISHGGISKLAQDENENIWIATQGGGLNKLDYFTEEISYFNSDQTTENALKSDYINDILIDRNQNMWIATEEGGLSKMNLRDESITTFRHDPNNKHSITSNKVSSIFEDKDQNIWIGDSEGYLMLYNPKENNFTSYDFLTQRFKDRKIRIMQIKQDWNGDLLLATNGAGLVIFNYKTGEAIINLHDNKNPKSISSNEAYSLIVDKNNTVFVGTFGRGISKYSLFNRKFETHLIPESNNFDGDINAFTDAAEDINGRLIVGTYYGFLVFDQKTWEYKHYLPGNTYEDNKILTVTVGPDGSIWLGSMSGLHRYDKNFNKIRTYVFDETLKDNSIYTIEFDYQNNLWIGLFSKGLLKISEADWVNTTKPSIVHKLYQIDYNNQKSICGNQNWIIYPHKDSSLWIGNEGGLCRYNYESDDFTRIFTTGLGAIKKIKIDSNGIIWMGTIGNGIFSYDLENNTYKQYDTQNGLCHNFVFGLIIDKNENIWISTENGLSKFNIKSEKFRNFDERDGLPVNRFDDASDSELANGHIYMGTNNGFIIFDPESIINDSSETKVVLTELKINNTALNSYESFINDTLVNIPIGQISTIEFNPSQRDFSFEFAALHYVAPHKIQYAYMLEGYDSDWIYTESDNRIARYTNLDGGNYTFMVKSTNADGKWTDESLIIPVVIHPPFYRTIWFLLIILMLILFLVLIIFRLRITREIRQKKVLEKKVKKRTIELSDKNALLKKTADDLTELNKLLKERQYQIEHQAKEITVQRDELKQINNTKDKLFSIIAHDLKNPFNVILGYTDLLITNFKEWDDKQNLEIMSYIKDSSSSTYILLENLLSWSRSQRGTMDFNPERMNISLSINMVLREVVPFARKKGVEVVNLLSNGLLTISADPNMLTLIYRNLLMNAIKFSNPGNKVFIDAEDHGNDFVRFSISDKGVGMEKDKIETLINPDISSSTRGTDGESGTGLGLMLCIEFVTLHKGKIWVESKVNEGSTFFFTIPKQIQEI
ncbi:MAG: hypothetical protein HQ541_13175 [Mariniphaga sp.]|nr:hypothetical protein [Mariniphaga sp.]